VTIETKHLEVFMLVVGGIAIAVMEVQKIMGRLAINPA